MSDLNEPTWSYFKLYPGNRVELADNFIIDLAQRMAAIEVLKKWFYLRYVDESGFHIRLRFLPQAGEQSSAERRVYEQCTAMMNRLYEYLPSTYRPMVTLPEFIAQTATPPVDPRLRIEEDKYQPEYEKYGHAGAMPIAEGVFHLSSQLAGQVLADEFAGIYSRKSIAPWLMREADRAFPTAVHPDYWRQYSLYWLGGDTPAANDWRGRFQRKGMELRDRNQPILPREADLPPEALAVIESWRSGLKSAARAYASLKDIGGTKPDVLSLNFSHLMLNRLGIATLEESYLASLIEIEQQAVAQEAVA